MINNNKKSFSKNILKPLGYQCDYKALKLSVKQRMQIIVRKDMTGNLKRSPFRIIIAIITVLALLIGGGKLQTELCEAKVPSPVSVVDNEVQLSFVGDIMLGRYVASFGEKNSYSSLFSDSQRLWERSKLVFANLECAVINEGSSNYGPDKNIKLPASPTALRICAKSGINVFSLANNHTADYGRDSVRNIIELLKENDIEYAGAGANRDDAGKYHLLEADGLTVGFVACTDVLPDGFAATNDDYGVCSAGYANLYENVLEASLYSDFVVVYIHWGNENNLRITNSQREIAQRLVDCGADIVIGSHPHILQEVEQYKNGIIFYSLGNYIFDQAARQSRNTIMLQLNADKATGDGLFTVIPMRINNFHPYETTNKFYISEIQRSLLKSLPSDAYTVLENGRIQIPIKLFTPGDKKVKTAADFELSEND